MLALSRTSLGGGTASAVGNQWHATWAETCHVAATDGEVLGAVKSGMGGGDGSKGCALFIVGGDGGGKVGGGDGGVRGGNLYFFLLPKKKIGSNNVKLLK